jgi:septal ring factor EnvC (AmiA/AmiB activator)
MATPDELRKKIEDLGKRTDTVNRRKSELQGLLQAKKDELAKLLTEIKAAGVDPKNLTAERDKAKTDLESMIASYEKDLASTEAALAAFDKKG